ncbi:hypothetical protein C8R45DRAFT_1098724 [Mycena sanguinolenta]|nr:hypothetical protein C8R45DRAFT_1098724 [Mycena sanguinolenta]
MHHEAAHTTWRSDAPKQYQAPGLMRLQSALGHRAPRRRTCLHAYLYILLTAFRITRNRLKIRRRTLRLEPGTDLLRLVRNPLVQLAHNNTAAVNRICARRESAITLILRSHTSAHADHAQVETWAALLLVSLLQGRRAA